jgi:hypothetical protein
VRLVPNRVLVSLVQLDRRVHRVHPALPEPLVRRGKPDLRVRKVVKVLPV